MSRCVPAQRRPDATDSSPTACRHALHGATTAAALVRKPRILHCPDSSLPSGPRPASAGPRTSGFAACGGSRRARGAGRRVPAPSPSSATRPAADPSKIWAAAACARRPRSTAPSGSCAAHRPEPPNRSRDEAARRDQAGTDQPVLDGRQAGVVPDEHVQGLEPAVPARADGVEHCGLDGVVDAADEDLQLPRRIGDRHPAVGHEFRHRRPDHPGPAARQPSDVVAGPARDSLQPRSAPFAAEKIPTRPPRSQGTHPANGGCPSGGAERIGDAVVRGRLRAPALPLERPREGTPGPARSPGRAPPGASATPRRDPAGRSRSTPVRAARARPRWPARPRRRPRGCGPPRWAAPC